MMTGYKKAIEWFQPRALKLLVGFVQDFIYRFIGSKIESFALKAIDPIVQPLASAVPSPVNQVVEVEVLLLFVPSLPLCILIYSNPLDTIFGILNKLMSLYSKWQRRP
jgi:hypothetical protein